MRPQAASSPFSAIVVITPQNRSSSGMKGFMICFLYCLGQDEGNALS
jgi:hypothetical protein